MLRAIGRLLAWIGGLVVVMALLAGAGAIYRAKQKKPVPAKTVLEVNLETALQEYAPDDPLAKLRGNEKVDLHSLTLALERAESDPRVVGMVAAV